MANNTKNLANAIVASDVGTTATTMPLEAGYGATMPALPFFLTCTPPGQLSTVGNSEVVLVTARTTDSLTIERAKKLTTAKNIQAGWVVSNSVYVETSTQIGDIITTLNAAPRVGRLFMDGGIYSKANYPLMWQYVNDNPGYGTTTTTEFGLKDMRGTTTAGKKSTGAFSGLLGSQTGAETHSLSIAQIPVHGFNFTLHGQENGSFIAGVGVTNGAVGGTGYGAYKAPPGSTGGASSMQNPGASWGSGQSHPIVQPTTIVNYEVIAE